MSGYRKVVFKLSLFFTAFVGLAVTFALVLTFTHPKTPFQSSDEIANRHGRAPSSVIYDADGEPVFWDVSLDEIGSASTETSKTDSQGSRPAKSRALFSHVKTLTMLEAERLTGIRAKRARLVRFEPESFRDMVLEMNRQGQRHVMFPLFDDTKLSVRLERPSSYSVNTGVYWGQVADDSESQARVFVEGLHMNATIHSGGRVFRVMTTEDQGSEHIVFEEAPIVR